MCPWLSSSAGYSIVLIRQGCGFDPPSGHIQETTNEHMGRWNNRLFLSLSLFPPPFLLLSPLPLSKISKLKKNFKLYVKLIYKSITLIQSKNIKGNKLMERHHLHVRKIEYNLLILIRIIILL